MQALKLRGVFVVLPGMKDYARALAMKIDRPDIEIMSLSNFERHRIQGRELFDFDIDHACYGVEWSNENHAAVAVAVQMMGRRNG